MKRFFHFPAAACYIKKARLFALPSLLCLTHQKTSNKRAAQKGWTLNILNFIENYLYMHEQIFVCFMYKYLY